MVLFNAGDIRELGQTGSELVRGRSPLESWPTRVKTMSHLHVSRHVCFAVEPRRRPTRFAPSAVPSPRVPARPSPGALLVAQDGPPPPLTVACRAGDGADPPRRRLSASPLPQGTLGGVAARSATHKGLSAHRGARRPPPPGRSATIVFPCGTHVGPPRPTCHLFFPRPTRPPPPPDAPASVRVCAFTVASSPPRGGGQHGRHVQRGQHGRA